MKKHILSVASIVVLGFSIASAQTEMPVRTVSGGVLNGKAQSLVKPVYPAAARAVKAEGAVSVQVVIDEQGSVASATAVSGHPLLRQAAEQAALQTKFAPTSLSGQPVKVSGIITYNFVGPSSAENWVKTGYDLASFEKFAIANPYSVSAMSAKIPAEWTSEGEQVKQLQKIAQSSNPSPADLTVKDITTLRGEKTTETAEKRIEGEVIKKMTVSRAVGVPAEAGAEQIAVVQNLTSSLQSRLGSDPKAAWQFNLGIALGRAFSNVRDRTDSQILIDALRQQVAAAPADVAPEYLESVNKIIGILESKEKTLEQRQQIGQLLSNLFKN